MRLRNNHPLINHGLIVGQQINHNGIEYECTLSEFGQYEIEPVSAPVMTWKKKTCY